MRTKNYAMILSNVLLVVQSQLNGCKNKLFLSAKKNVECSLKNINELTVVSKNDLNRQLG